MVFPWKSAGTISRAMLSAEADVRDTLAHITAPALMDSGFVKKLRCSARKPFLVNNVAFYKRRGEKRAHSLRTGCQPGAVAERRPVHGGNHALFRVAVWDAGAFEGVHSFYRPRIQFGFGHGWRRQFAHRSGREVQFAKLGKVVLCYLLTACERLIGALGRHVHGRVRGQVALLARQGLPAAALIDQDFPCRFVANAGNWFPAGAVILDDLPGGLVYAIFSVWHWRSSWEDK